MSHLFTLFLLINKLISTDPVTIDSIDVNDAVDGLTKSLEKIKSAKEANDLSIADSICYKNTKLIIKTMHLYMTAITFDFQLKELPNTSKYFKHLFNYLNEVSNDNFSNLINIGSAVTKLSHLKRIYGRGFTDKYSEDLFTYVISCINSLLVDYIDSEEISKLESLFSDIMKRIRVEIEDNEDYITDKSVSDKTKEEVKDQMKDYDCLLDDYKNFVGLLNLECYKKERNKALNNNIEEVKDEIRKDELHFYVLLSMGAVLVLLSGICLFFSFNNKNEIINK